MSLRTHTHSHTHTHTHTLSLTGSSTVRHIIMAVTITILQNKSHMLSPSKGHGGPGPLKMTTCASVLPKAEKHFPSYTANRKATRPSEKIK